jgi:glycosyltransferase involved in cell wall biosynthesis
LDLADNDLYKERHLTSVFSVVIPLYNKSPYIEACINSVLQQSEPADEIIVVDDGSTDASVAIVERRFGHHVKLVRQSNAGVSAARNVGISAARNEFICLLDADDRWEVDFLQEMKALVLSFDQCVFYGCGYWFEDVKQGHLQVPTGLPDTFFGPLDFLQAYTKGNGVICSSSVCVRKSVLAITGAFPIGKISGEDIHLWLRLGMLGQFGFSGRLQARIRRDEVAGSYLSRLNVIPCHIEWMIGQLSNNIDPSNKRILRSMLRKHVITNGLLAVEQHNKTLLFPMIIIVRRQDLLLAFLLSLFYLVPSAGVRLLRKIIAIRRRQ